MDVMQLTHEREPSFTFSFMTDSDNIDLPRVSTPCSEAPPALVWNFSGLRRSDSIFGAFSLSREQSREHSFGLGDLAAPATNDSTVSDMTEMTDMTEDAETVSSEAETEEYESSEHLESSDHLDELFSGEVPQPPCEEPAQRPVPVYDAVAQRFTFDVVQPSLKRTIDMVDDLTEEAVEFPYEQEWKRSRKAGAGTGKRGAHVRERPQMQQTARDGQKHWGNKVQELRVEWQQKRIWEQHEAFHEQIRMCSRLHIKSQHECFLRQLQMALVEGLIRLPEDKEFTTDDNCSFLGWTGFEVVPSRGAEFRRRIEEMFANPPQDKTLNNTLRRAGLVPQRGWGEAWNGVGAFVFDSQKRAQYSGKE